MRKKSTTRTNAAKTTAAKTTATIKEATTKATELAKDVYKRQTINGGGERGEECCLTTWSSVLLKQVPFSAMASRETRLLSSSVQ